MSERRENSVLVALKELRGIEDDRVKREQEEARARQEATRAAKEAAELRARDEESARRAAEEEKLRRAEEKQAKIREEHLRIEDAERRARVEGEVRLQEERMRLEIQSRAQHKSPVKAIVGVAVALALLGGGIVYKITAAHKEELAEKDREAREAKEQERKEKAAQAAEFSKKLAAIKNEMNEALKSAKNDAEREAIRKEAARKEAAAEDHSGKTHKRGPGTASNAEQGKTATGLHVPGKREISNGILDGL